MKKMLFAVVLVLSLTACYPMSETRATRALESQGYKDITLTGISLFGCAEEDFFRTGFTATGQNGAKVEGTVCGGFLKGTTVRVD